MCLPPAIGVPVICDRRQHMRAHERATYALSAHAQLTCLICAADGVAADVFPSRRRWAMLRGCAAHRPAGTQLIAFTLVVRTCNLQRKTSVHAHGDNEATYALRGGPRRATATDHDLRNGSVENEGRYVPRTGRHAADRFDSMPRRPACRRDPQAHWARSARRGNESAGNVQHERDEQVRCRRRAPAGLAVDRLERQHR